MYCVWRAALRCVGSAAATVDKTKRKNHDMSSSARQVNWQEAWHVCWLHKKDSNGGVRENGNVHHVATEYKRCTPHHLYGFLLSGTVSSRKKPGEAEEMHLP